MSGAACQPTLLPARDFFYPFLQCFYVGKAQNNRPKFQSSFDDRAGKGARPTSCGELIGDFHKITIWIMKIKGPKGSLCPHPAQRPGHQRNPADAEMGFHLAQRRVRKQTKISTSRGGASCDLRDGANRLETDFLIAKMESPFSGRVLYRLQAKGFLIKSAGCGHILYNQDQMIERMNVEGGFQDSRPTKARNRVIGEGDMLVWMCHHSRQPDGESILVFKPRYKIKTVAYPLSRFSQRVTLQCVDGAPNLFEMRTFMAGQPIRVG